MPRPDPTPAVDRHIHEPMMAVLTCMCGSRAVLLADGRLEAVDHNWQALDRFYEKMQPKVEASVNDR